MTGDRNICEQKSEAESVIDYSVKQKPKYWARRGDDFENKSWIVYRPFFLIDQPLFISQLAVSTI